MLHTNIMMTSKRIQVRARRLDSIIGIYIVIGIEIRNCKSKYIGNA